MKYRIDHGESWPVYKLASDELASDEFITYSEDGFIELTYEEYADYQRMDAEWAAWQKRLADQVARNW